MEKLYRRLFLMAAVMLLPMVGQSQNVYYSCDFEDVSDSAGWVFVDGSQPSYWMIGCDSANMGSRGMFITDDSVSNEYNSGSPCVSYAYREFELAAGAYYVSYNWHGYGEGSYDFLRVFLAPSSASLTAGVLPGGGTSSYSFGNTVPAGWIALDGAARLNLASAWQTYSCEFNVSTADTYKLVFMWCNDGSVGTSPAAAVDNVVFTQPSCPTPAFPHVENLTTTSFDLYWSDRSDGASTSWVVELDSATQTLGHGTLFTVYDTTITFTGLTPNTQYTVWVQAVCGGNDTSMMLRYQMRTPCTFMSTVPYFQGFETASAGSTANPNFVECWSRLSDSLATNYWPYVSSSSTYSHSGSRGLYWYCESLTGYRCVALPGLDTDYVPLRNLQLKFWAKPTSASYQPVFEVGVMTDPNDVNTFTLVSRVEVNSTDWDEYIVGFDSYVGTGNFIALKATGGSSYWYAALDDFTIERVPACQSVNHVEKSNVGTTGALLTWNVRSGRGMPATYQIRVDSVLTVGSLPTVWVDSTDTVSHPVYFTTSEPRCLVTGLEPNTAYRAIVRAVCDNDSISGWDSVFFTTHGLPCAVSDPNSIDTVVFSSGTNQVSGVPVYSGWGNTVCQSIYTADELVAMGITAGMITGLDYGFTANSTYAKVFSIYVTTTERSTFSSTADMVTVRAADLLYGPAAHPLNTVGTVHYNFTTPFQWDGTSNIVITTMMNQPNGASHSSSGFYGYSTSAGVARTIYRYQDGTQFTPANCTGGSGGGSTIYRPSITIYTMGCIADAECAAPTILIDRLESDTVAVSWIPGYEESSWDILIKEADSAAWDTVATNYSNNSYVFSTLHAMRNYQLKIIPSCGGDSVWAQAAFTTPCVPVVTLPFYENFENFTASSTSGSPITDCWHRGSSYSYSAYPYISSSYANSGTRSMYFYNPSSYYTYLALPAMATGVDSLQVSFAAFKTGTYTIRVGVMNDPEDFSTFTEIATVSPASTNNWEMFEVPLRDYEGTGRYIALATGMSNYNYMYIDDIEVSLIPNCQRPTSITFSSITTTQASVAWVDTSATDFEIEYGPSGFALGTGTRVTSSLSSVTLYGLTHSTRYDVYVRGICTLSDTSNWSFVSSFITECGMISNLPYTQNFSNWGVGTGARPACWACGGYSSYPYIVNVTNSASQVIGRTLYMYSYASNRVYASLPELDSVTYPIHIVQTVFKAWTNNTTSTYYSHNLIVGVCSAQGELSTFTPIDTIELTDTPMEYEVSFDNAMGTGKYITFVSTAMDGATYNYVYIDSIAVELIPDCQRPNNLIASGMTATTAALSWNDRTSALGWEVEYNLHGFGVGSGTRITTISNPLNVTGLLPSTSYDFYVRAICGPGDTSDWSRTPYNFTTLQNPATVPYFYDMESSVEWDNWQIASNSPITWYRDTAAGNGTNGYGTTGTHSMYISADSGQTCSTHINEVVNAVAYRDFDFGNIDSSYILSFRASAGGCRVDNSVYDGLAVFMVDPNTPLQPSSNNPLVSPWGNVNDLTLLATVYCQPGWNTYTAIIDTLTGIHRIVFYWFNQNTTSIGIFLGSPAAVDDISIQYMECPRPAGVRATNVTMGSARVVWHGYEDADYRVTLRSSTGGIVSSTLVHGTNIHFSGLTPATTYNAYVRRLCGENDSSMLPSCSFTTLLCNDGTTDTIGNAYSTTTSYNIPVNNFYNYSYTQELVLASELGNNVGEISGINFYYTGSSAITSKAGCTIYMGHTTLSSFSSTTDIVDPADMSIVYTGNFNFSPGWNQIRLNNPYPYDGTRNLVIAIDDNSGHYQGTSYTFRTSPATAQMTVTYYSDSYNIDCSSLSALQSFTGTKEAYGYRNLFTLDICGPNSCPLPTLRDPIVRSHNVTLRWRNTGTTYNVGYRLATSSSWISNNITTTDTFYTINTLYPMTDYVYHVRQHCDTNGVSNWAEGQFNSSDVPCLSPMDLHLVSVTNSKAKLAWTPEENNIGYRLRIYNTYYDQTYTTYLASKTVTGLESNTRYYATVQATCQDLDDPSEWCDPISFVTDVCPDAYNLTASNVQGNSVDLDWSADDRHVGWVIEYGYEGFDAGSGVAVEADHHPFQLTGLTGETTYDIFVRGVCGSNFMSENWSNRVTITTLYSGIHSITDDVRVHLFPNPTSSDVELTLPAVGSAVKVEVIDVAGRTQLSCTLPVGTEKATLATSQLPQGAYYVRVTGGDINTIKKLVVR